MIPSYFLSPQREFQEKADKAWELLSACKVCPRKCGVNRLKEKTGFCQMGENPVVSSYYPHHWEERCISGQNGSGIIFFTSCNSACVYCQNWEISQKREGEEVTIERLGEMMVELESLGCHNINLCTPSIWVPQILKALIIAIDRGLKVPLVYNTGGHDSVETLKILEGIIDIYMPDIKYSDNKIGLKYSQVSNYWTVVQKAVAEMHRQVGDLVIENGLATRGLLIRHLVLPNNLAGTKKVMKFLARLSKDTYINIMDQYYPTNKAGFYPELNRRITTEEFKNALMIAKKEGLWRFDKFL